METKMFPFTHILKMGKKIIIIKDYETPEDYG